MGQSTDGILAYGIDFGEELPGFLEGFDDLDEYFESISGLPLYGQPGHDFSKTWAHRDTCPVEHIRYCSGEYPMHILAVRGVNRNVSRGYVEEVETLDVDAEKSAAFKDWLAERDVTDVPKWLLCSMWN